MLTVGEYRSEYFLDILTPSYFKDSNNISSFVVITYFLSFKIFFNKSLVSFSILDTSFSAK